MAFSLTYSFLLHHPSSSSSFSYSSFFSYSIPEMKKQLPVTLLKQQCWASEIPHRSRIHKMERISCNPNGSCFPVNKKEVAVVWFKKDLRIDDHPGLLASSSYRFVVPLYIIDPDILASWPIYLLEALLEALADLRQALRRIGSDLIIRKGRVFDELLTVAREVGASDIITEQEVESEWRDCVQVDTQGDEETHFRFWTGPLYAFEHRNLPTSYRLFQTLQCPVNLPLEAPCSLPALPSGLHKGRLPSISELGRQIGKSFIVNRWQESFIKKEAANSYSDLVEKPTNGSAKFSNCFLGESFEGFLTWREQHIFLTPYEALQKRENGLLLFLENAGRQLQFVGSSTIINALRDYFRCLDTIWMKDWKRIYKQIMQVEGDTKPSFSSSFGIALALGNLSRRRVYHEALEYQKSCSRSWLSHHLSSYRSAAALEAIKSMEWYRMLAIVTMEDGRNKEWNVHYWNWRGFLIQYNTSGSEGACIVLVHGFGSFAEHYRDNIKGLATKRNRVWALTLLGFGRSEKPSILYTELLWSELIRDFIVEVVREPAILVGNSIGGYMVSSVAGHWPSIVKALILLNTAGNVLPDYFSIKYLKPREKSGLAWAGGWLLLFSLRILCSHLLKTCYPKRPWRADNWLLSEIIRASYDPGAFSVLQSLLQLKRPLPINYFIDCYKKKVLVIQGVKDPLKRTNDRVKMLRSCCENVVVKLIDAGHCPHDESPEEVNTIITDWIQKVMLLDPCNTVTNGCLCGDSANIFNSQSRIFMASC